MTKSSFLSRLFGRQPTGEPIIVVSGLPRSGTSMLMRMLSAGGLNLVVDGIRTADKDNPNGYFELEKVKELDKGSDTSWLADARGKGLKIISFLLPHLPDAYRYRIIFLRRSISEVLASQKKMLNHRGESAGDTSDDDMAKFFATHITQVETLLASRQNCTVLYVEHRQAISDPAAVAREVSEFVGRTLNVEAMTAAVDSRLYRNKA